MRIMRLEQEKRKLVKIRFFYRKCAICGDLVKGERMWRENWDDYADDIGLYVATAWYCMKCAPTHESFIQRCIETTKR